MIVYEDLDTPTGIAVDPRVGYLFWTDNGDNSKIERATLDGSDRKIIYEFTNTALFTDIIIDYTRNKIVWCDKYNSLIIQSNYDGLEVEIIAGSAFKIVQPYSIDLKNDTIYWIEQ